MSRSLISSFILILFIVLSVSAAEKIDPKNNSTDDDEWEFDPTNYYVKSGRGLFVESGGQIRLLSGATLTTNSGSTVTFNGTFAQSTLTADPTGGSATAIRALDTNDTVVFLVDTDSNPSVVATSTQNNQAAFFVVEDSAGTNALEVSTVTNSVSIRNDLTLGVTGVNSIIDSPTSEIRMFPPGDTAFANSLILRGNITMSGDLFLPQGTVAAMFQSLEINDQKQQKEMKELVSSVFRLDKEVLNTQKTLEVFSPETKSLLADISKSGTSKNLKTLVSGKEVSADGLHTHEVFPKDVKFEKDVLIEGELMRLPQKDSVLTFAEESFVPVLTEYGFAELKNGEATIALDLYFLSQVVISDRSPLVIQLVPEGDCNGLYIASRDQAGFRVKELRDGKSNVSFQWSVKARRKGFSEEKYQILERHGKRKRRE